MTAADLIADLAQLRIQLEAHGDRLRYSPRSVVTPDLADQMRAHKGELLAMLRSDTADATSTDLGRCPHCDARLAGTLTFDGFLNLECSWCDRCVGCRPSSEEVAARFSPFETASTVTPLTLGVAADSLDDSAGVEQIGTIGPLPPCRECGGLEMWETAAGDLFGRIDGRWQCLWCDPPAKSRRLRELAARLKTIAQDRRMADP